MATLQKFARARANFKRSKLIHHLGGRFHQHPSGREFSTRSVGLRTAEQYLFSTTYEFTRSSRQVSLTDREVCASLPTGTRAASPMPRALPNQNGETQMTLTKNPKIGVFLAAL